MTLLHEQRPSDSPYVAGVLHGHTLAAGSSIRPAESHWHLVVVRHQGAARLIAVGPWSAAGVAAWGEGAEILWLRFRLGTFMPHLPVKQFRDSELTLPEAAGHKVWLNGSAWELPTYENADTFVHRLVRADMLTRDPVVSAALDNQRPDIPGRTLRHRFLHSTGLSETAVRQIERAQRAAALLRQGSSILDTVHESGYFDQPHLTRALKQWVGHTPAQLLHLSSTP